ncbi:MAG: hypothetical protein HY366_00400 [Candidatus Aenigmarchaeota archaeon]|nr:hypothetical protein [Candidatus Aenigmarchaeota archaeon]
MHVLVNLKEVKDHDKIWMDIQGKTGVHAVHWSEHSPYFGDVVYNGNPDVLVKELREQPYVRNVSVETDF